MYVSVCVCLCVCACVFVSVYVVCAPGCDVCKDPEGEMRKCEATCLGYKRERGKWIYRHCLSLAGNDLMREKRSNQPFVGSATAMASISAHLQGHLLAICEDQDGIAVVFCIRCGSCASTKPRDLKLPCPRTCAWHSNGYRNLTKIRGGCHPAAAQSQKCSELVMLDGSVRIDASKAAEMLLEREARRARSTCSKGLPRASSQHAR